MKKIDNAKVISTKKGDEGTSRNYSNDVLEKTDILFDAVGSIDELSSLLGVVYHQCDYKSEIKRVQLDLQHIMSLLATNINDRNFEKLIQIDNDDINWIENLEQSILNQCEILPRFVLPGSDSSIAGAYLDLARSITRRTERIVIMFAKEYQRHDLDTVKRYLNRLSDLLFIMARSRD